MEGVNTLSRVSAETIVIITLKVINMYRAFVMCQSQG